MRMLKTGGLAAALLTSCLLAPLPASADATELVSILVGKMGISPKQAAGGAGAVFELAQQRMSADQFGKVADSVPGVDNLIDQAPELTTSASGGATAGAASSLGGSAKALGTGAMGVVPGVSGASSLTALSGPFQSLGLSNDQIAPMVETVVGYVEQEGGASVSKMLGSALLGG
ncbi:MAG: DUF2780 domain-containing protein [Rhodospirillales bacterium]|nr:DUF2780 domain-containing protein [Rhodospirillales bacterium]